MNRVTDTGGSRRRHNRVMSLPTLPERAPVVVETDRLALRWWQSGDVGPMSRINADPEVMRWIGSGAAHTATRGAPWATA